MEQVSVPAIGGEWAIDPEGALFPRADAVAVTTSYGSPGVQLSLVDPGWQTKDGYASAVFTAPAVRQLVTALQQWLVSAEPVARPLGRAA